MVRLLVQFTSNDPLHTFGSPLQELGTFKTVAEAKKMAISLIDDTVDVMLISLGNERWLKIGK
jgi:hypothetical protein